MGKKRKKKSTAAQRHRRAMDKYYRDLNKNVKRLLQLEKKARKAEDK